MLSLGASNLLNDNYGNRFTVAKKYVTGDLSRLDMFSAKELLDDDIIERALTIIDRQRLSTHFRLVLLERELKTLQEQINGSRTDTTPKS